MVDWLPKRTENSEITSRNGSDLGRFRSFLLRSISFASGSLVLFSLVISFVYSFCPVPLTPLMAYRMGQSLALGRLPQIEKSWMPIEKLSPRLIHAVIAAEDMRFYEHHGFDWEAIAKAREYNAHPGHPLKRGASTISQQVAKNVFLFPHRSWIRKGLEAYFTLLIETFWSKQRLMEVYLNVVELGDGVYGAEAAARTYFKKSAGDVSASEAALMAAVLPNPRRFRIAKPTAYVRMRQERIRNRMTAAAATVPTAGLSSSPSLKKTVRKSGLPRARSIPGSR